MRCRVGGSPGCRNGRGLDKLDFVDQAFDLCDPFHQFGVLFGCLFLAVFAEVADEVDLVLQLAASELF